MENNLRKDPIDIISANWKKLRNLIINQGEFDYELFKDTFNKSYAILAPCSYLTTVDKEVLRLVVSAYSFVQINLPAAQLDFDAAVILTERMLHCCVVDPTVNASVVEGTKIYVFETQEDIYLDFNHPDEAMAIIKKTMS